ncbi:hypothetical protein [Mucilaginibacter sp. CSA2-8R]|uniref:hypothetical protein n=1 Tax=Mucilaginibacter sp. CSA2-8R TaxID=3141542 RepID=UPI00315C7C1B
MKNLLTIVLTLINLSAIACHCSVIPEFKDKNDLKPYEFIALAKVAALSPTDTAKPWFRRRDGDIKIEIIELFKGAKETVINEPNVNSSCDLGINMGEQWLFFGSKGKDKIEIQPCNYNIKYRDVSGLRDWQYFRGIDRLNVLIRLFYPDKFNPLTDTIKYDNDLPEIVQHFKNGKLQGERQIFYPSGKLYISEKFNKGERVKYRKVYSAIGQLIYNVRYGGGGLVKVRTSYYDILELKRWIPIEARINKATGEIYNVDDPQVKRALDSIGYTLAVTKPSLRYKTTFSHHGRNYISYGYNQQGKVTNYRNVNSRKKVAELYRYHDDGSIETYRKLDAVNNQEIEHDYHLNEARRDFLLPCESCKYYFNPEYDNGSKPEAVYLW